MSVIVSEVYDALLSAGAPEAQARAAAGAIPIQDNVATRQDLAELKAELKTEIGVLKFAVFTFFPIVIGLLVKIAFFPG
jgi:hypothetical protein